MKSPRERLTRHSKCSSIWMVLGIAWLSTGVFLCNGLWGTDHLTGLWVSVPLFGTVLLAYGVWVQCFIHDCVTFDHLGIYAADQIGWNPPPVVVWQAIADLQAVQVPSDWGQDDAILLTLRSAADHPCRDTLPQYRETCRELLGEADLPEFPYLIDSFCWRMPIDEVEETLREAQIEFTAFSKLFLPN